MINGDHAGRAVGHNPGDGKGTDAAGAFFHANMFLLYQCADTADACSHDDADALPVVVGDDEVNNEKKE
jgi:hypothetical protein